MTKKDADYWFPKVSELWCEGEGWVFPLPTLVQEGDEWVIILHYDEDAPLYTVDDVRNFVFAYQ